MYPAVVPITDRIDYMNNIAMEYGYCLAVEKLLDVEIPPRADAIRALMNEFSRIMSHIPSLGFLMLELGDRKSTRLNSSHANISYAVFCLKKKKTSRS